jgi:hypothetical protein
LTANITNGINDANDVDPLKNKISVSYKKWQVTTNQG